MRGSSERVFEFINGTPETTNNGRPEYTSGVRSSTMRAYRRTERMERARKHFEAVQARKERKEIGNNVNSDDSGQHSICAQPSRSVIPRQPDAMVNWHRATQELGDGPLPDFSSTTYRERNELLLTWADKIATLLLPLGPAGMPNPLGAAYLREAVHSEVLQYAMCANASKLLDMIKGMPTPSARTMHYNLQTVHHVNIALRSNEPAADGTIAAVGALIGDELIAGDVPTLRIHLEGLRRLVNLRGGVDQLGIEGALRHSLVAVDNSAAVLTGSLPVLTRPLTSSRNAMPFTELEVEYQPTAPYLLGPEMGLAGSVPYVSAAAPISTSPLGASLIGSSHVLTLCSRLRALFALQQRCHPLRPAQAADMVEFAQERRFVEAEALTARNVLAVRQVNATFISSHDYHHQHRYWFQRNCSPLLADACYTAILIISHLVLRHYSASRPVTSTLLSSAHGALTALEEYGLDIPSDEEDTNSVSVSGGEEEQQEQQLTNRRLYLWALCVVAASAPQSDVRGWCAVRISRMVVELGLLGKEQLRAAMMEILWTDSMGDPNDLLKISDNCAA